MEIDSTLSPWPSEYAIAARPHTYIIRFESQPNKTQNQQPQTIQRHEQAFIHIFANASGRKCCGPARDWSHRDATESGKRWHDLKRKVAIGRFSNVTKRAVSSSETARFIVRNSAFCSPKRHVLRFIWYSASLHHGKTQHIHPPKSSTENNKKDKRFHLYSNIPKIKQHYWKLIKKVLYLPHKHISLTTNCFTMKWRVWKRLCFSSLAMLCAFAMSSCSSDDFYSEATPSQPIPTSANEVAADIQGEADNVNQLLFKRMAAKRERRLLFMILYLRLKSAWGKRTQKDHTPPKQPMG